MPQINVPGAGRIAAHPQEEHTRPASGLITTVAGIGTRTGSIDGEGDYPADDLGDGGLAINASLAIPVGVAGNLYIADRLNDRVRFVSGTGSSDPVVLLIVRA